MSVAMSSNTEAIRVYVRLLGEGTVVFRPTPAVPLGAGTVKLLAPSDYDPDDEDWEFKPGSIVQVEPRTLEGEAAYLAVTLSGHPVTTRYQIVPPEERLASRYH
jgi:hypothetical protein